MQFEKDFNSPLSDTSRGNGPRKISARVALLIALFLFQLAAGIPGWGQNATGTVVGVVRDTTGSIIPNARVTLTRLDTQQTSTTASNADGYYSFVLLRPAQYVLSVTANGFKEFRQKNILVNVATTITVDASLPVGETTETVTVDATPPQLELQSPALGTVIGEKAINELPLNGRNSYSFVQLVPGVFAPSGFTSTAFDEAADEAVSINGSGPTQSLFLLDGGYNSSAAFNGPNYFPMVDLVQEYNVQTNNFSAEFPHTAGGVINVITRSGAERFHGAVWEFYRGTDLEANTFFSNRTGLPRAPFFFHQFGGTIGGPILKRRTFFFFGYEGIRWNQTGNVTGTLPTAAMRSGDFTGFAQLYDPYSTKPDPARPGHYIRTAYANNQITNIDPVAKNLLTYLPLPNGPGLINNYTTTFVSPITENSFSLRIDHEISEKQKVFGRFSINDTTQSRPNIYGDGSPKYAIASPTLGNDTLRQMQATLNYTNVLKPTVLFDFTSSFARHFIFRQIPGLGVSATAAGFPSYFDTLAAQYPPCFPAAGASGYGVTLSLANNGGGLIGTGCQLLRNPFQTAYQSANITIEKNTHTIKIGGNFADQEMAAANFTAAGPSFNATSSFTQGPDPTAGGSTGNSFATFLVGMGTGSTRSGGPNLILPVHFAGLYVNDTWRATPKLTINAGLRWDLNRPWTERHNQLTNFSFTAPSPLQVSGLSLVGGLIFPATNGLPRGQFDANYLTFGPRAGFAYQVQPGTALRGGFGVFVAPISGTGFNGNSVPTSGFTATTTWASSVDGINPLYPLSNPFPNGFVAPTGSSLGLSTFLGQDVVAMERHRPNSYAEQWNLDLQQQFPGAVLLELAYAGDHGIHLYYDRNADQLPDQYLSQGTALNAQVANPFYGKITTGNLSAATVAASQLLRPFPQFNSVTLGNSSVYAASIYHALNAKLEKRFNHGFQFTVAYTWSKLMSNAPPSDSGFPGSSVQISGIQDWYNLAAEWAVADFDTPNYLAINGIYELPFGKNKMFLNKGRVVDSIIGGWQLNGILTSSSGSPLEITTATNTLFNYGGVQRVNWSGRNPTKPGRIENRLSAYFDTTVFSAPGSYKYGNSPRQISALRTPGLINMDLSGIKRVTIHDNVKAEFRAEAFNLFNHPRFGNPGTSLGNAAFGVISTQVNLPRQIQFAGKVTF